MSAPDTFHGATAVKAWDKPEKPRYAGVPFSERASTLARRRGEKEISMGINLDRLFDLAHATRHVDKIFTRVFGE